jgi:glycogen operon protein
LAFTAEAWNEKLLFHLILNAYWEPLDFELPPLANSAGDSWRRWIDTTLDSPQDIVEWQTAPLVPSRTYKAGPRSVVVLFARVGDGASPSLQSGSNAGVKTHQRFSALS